MGAYHLVRALQALNAQQAYARFGWRTLGGSPPHVDAGMPTCGHTQEARALRPSWVLHAAAMCTDRRAAMSTYVCQGAETCSRGHATQKVPGKQTMQRVTRAQLPTLHAAHIHPQARDHTSSGRGMTAQQTDRAPGDTVRHYNDAELQWALRLTMKPSTWHSDMPGSPFIFSPLQAHQPFTARSPFKTSAQRTMHSAAAARAAVNRIDVRN